MRGDEVPADAVRGTRRPRRSRRAARGRACRSRAAARAASLGGPDLVRPPALEQLAPAVREPEVRAEELVRRAEQHVGAGVGRPRCRRAARSAPRRPTRARLPRGRARRPRAPGSPSRPRSMPRGTRRPASGPRAASAGGRGRAGTRRRARRSARSAACRRELSQGETFASWSSRVTTTSSPSLPVARGGAREREVERRHVRAEDDLVGRSRRGGRRRRRAPRRRRRRSPIEVRNVPPRFAFARAGSRDTPRSPSRAPACPPGPSKKASGAFSAVKRARTASIVRRHPVAIGAHVADGSGPSGRGPTVGRSEAQAADRGRVLRPLLRRAAPTRSASSSSPALAERRRGSAEAADEPERAGEARGRVTRSCASWTSRRRYAPPVKGRPRPPLPSGWICTATWMSRLPRCRPRGRTRL